MEILPVSLVGLKHSFGERTVDNSEIEIKYGLPAGWILEKTGKEKGHAWDNGPDSPTKASLECLRLLLEAAGIEKTQIGAVFGTTNPIVIDGIPREESLTKIFAERAGFSGNADVCDRGWGCGGSAVGIDSLKSWLQAAPEGNYALYVTQDWSTKMVKDRNVAALFSDAVSVSLWTNGPTGIAEIIDCFSADSTIADEALGIVDGFWEMDGKEVTRVASAVPALVAEKLSIDLKNYDIVSHQPNAKLLETMEGIYGVHCHKKVAREHGNVTCSGALIALEEVLEDRSRGVGTNTDKDILVMPFGAGGIGGFILRNKKQSV